MSTTLNCNKCDHLKPERLLECDNYKAALTYNATRCQYNRCRQCQEEGGKVVRVMNKVYVKKKEDLQECFMLGSICAFRKKVGQILKCTSKEVGKTSIFWCHNQRKKNKENGK